MGLLSEVMHLKVKSNGWYNPENINIADIVNPLKKKINMILPLLIHSSGSALGQCSAQGWRGLEAKPAASKSSSVSLEDEVHWIVKLSGCQSLVLNMGMYISCGCGGSLDRWSFCIIKFLLWNKRILNRAIRVWSHKVSFPPGEADGRLQPSVVPSGALSTFSDIPLSQELSMKNCLWKDSGPSPCKINF